MFWIVATLGILAAVVAVSYLVEAARTEPPVPARLAWAPELPIRFVDVAGVRLRYVVTGEGPDLVLLHTLRTQLDMFQKVIPILARRFRVYALDLPGHGYSDIPAVDYPADFFVDTVATALDRLGVRDATVVGESIGGSIALQLAARHHPAVARVVAVNAYDYAGGRGLRRSSALANLLFGVNDVPVLGATVGRLRSYPVVRQVLRGGIQRRAALSPALAREIYQVGNRRGHARGFASLVRHWASWDAGRAEYGRIDRPVLLVYGDHDWSREHERLDDAARIPGAELRTVPDAGHFLSLDAPEALAAAVLDWTPAPAPQRRA
jgi:pimeloyl-ACP methyl ester carboxylesterase